MAFTLENTTRSAMCDAAVDLLDAGSGAGRMDITTAGDVVLSSHTLSDPAFGAASDGVATASAIGDDTSANATGTAAKCKWYDSDSTLYFTGTVTAAAGGGDIELNSTSISAGVTVSINASGTITMPAS